MSANISDRITDTRNAARPNSTTVSAPRSTGGNSLSCANLTGWPTASKVHFVTYKIDSNSAVIAGTQLDCYGIVSGNTIGSFTVVDGTDSGNAIGDIVEMLPTAAWGQDLADALTSTHNRSGGLKTGIALTAPTITDFTSATHTHANNAGGGQLSEGAFVQGAIGAVDLSTSAITLGYAQITSNIGSLTSAAAAQVTGLTVTVTIPAGGRRVKVTVWSRGFVNTNVTTNTISLWNGTVGSGTQLADKQAFTASATAATDNTIIFSHVPAAGSITYNVGYLVAAGTGTWQATSTSPSFILVELI